MIRMPNRVQPRLLYLSTSLDNLINLKQVFLFVRRELRWQGNPQIFPFFVSSVLARIHNGRAYGIRKALYIRHI